MKTFTAPLFEIASLQGRKSVRKLLPPHHLTALLPTKGFTLLEIIVAITLMGIVAGFSIPGLYGSYQHQQMLNTANEMIAAINQARAKAQANYQGAYVVSAAQGGPLSDCTTSYPYVDAYNFRINSNKNGYEVYQTFRDNDAGTCKKPNPLPGPVLSGQIPSPITVSQTSSGTFPLSFETTSGQFNIGPGTTAWIDLISNGFLSNVHYYVCITQNNIYAQNTAC